MAESYSFGPGQPQGPEPVTSDPQIPREPVDGEGQQQQQQGPFPNIDQLYKWAQSQNIANEIDPAQLKKVAATLIQEVDEDDNSMEDWRQEVDAAMDLAKQARETKSSPWKDASNVKLPMIQDAVLQFAAKSYGKLLAGAEWVKAEHPGMKGQENLANSIHGRAKRVTKYLEYQLRHELDGWEQDFDLKLHVLPWVGIAHKKTYYDPSTGKCKSEMVLHDDLIIHQGTMGLKNARVTHIRRWTQNEYYELVSSGAYKEIEYPDHDTPEGEASRPETDGMTTCWEICGWYDLDDDGYKEPYIVTIHKASQMVVRMVPRFDPDDVMFSPEGRILRIEPDQIYTKYEFYPNPDGSYWSLGWGKMVGPLNETANTLTNQLLDAGTLANSGAGVVDQSVRVIGGGRLKFEPGMWPRVRSTNGRLADSFFPLPVRGPDGTLFTMLQEFDNWIRRISTTPETVAENTPANAPVGTTLAKIEQAERVGNAVDKRIYRAWSEELTKLFMLNHRYIDPMQYAKVLNLPVLQPGQPVDPQAEEQPMAPEQVAQMAKADFAIDDLDVLPTANPETSSRTMRLAQADFVRTTAMEGAQLQQVNGDIDINAILLEVWDAAGIENPDRFFKQPTPEEIEAQQMAQDIQEAMAELEVQDKFESVQKVAAETLLTRQKAITEGAQPEKVEAEVKKLEADAKQAAKPAA